MIHTKHIFHISLGLVGMSLLFGYFLLSNPSFAEDSDEDYVSITIPVACTMTGTGMNSHNATIPSNTYQTDIGTTTLKAYCNDTDGFSIYAVGYTDETEGKNVLTNASLGSTSDILTGTALSGDTSSWAMKLQTNSSDTYPIEIKNDYDDYHNVPNDYDLVAKRTSNTDQGVSAIGSTLTTTYQAYISGTQHAGDYSGKVKYSLVHPNYVNGDTLKNAVTVIYDGNGQPFPDGSSTNTVKYAKVCKPGEMKYVGNEYREVMSSNISTGGTQNGPYTNQENMLQTVTFSGANQLKVVVDYAITAETMGVTIAEGSWDGNFDTVPRNSHNIYGYNNLSGIDTYIIDGDTTTIYMESWDTPVAGYDKGAYIKVYPVYNTAQPNTTYEELPSQDCSIMPISGSYSETAEWHHKWTLVKDGNETEFIDADICEDEICDNTTAEYKFERFLTSAYNSFKGKTITLSAYNPVTFDEAYASANKTKLDGYYVIQDLNTSMCSTVSSNQTSTVIDSRDHSLYEIIKLTTGDCWLRDNLKLDPTDSTTASNMSASNTNASNDAIYNYLHGGNPNNNTGWTTNTVSNVASGLGHIQAYDSYTIPYIHNEQKDTKKGVYYNYCAASVGTHCYDKDQYIAGGGTITYDLCPSNWHIPTEDNWNTVHNFNRKLAASTLGTFDFAYTNYYSSGESVFWSSSFSSDTQARIARSQGGYIDDDFSGAAAYRENIHGYLIRCVIPTSEP